MAMQLAEAVPASQPTPPHPRQGQSIILAIKRRLREKLLDAYNTIEAFPYQFGIIVYFWWLLLCLRFNLQATGWTEEGG